MYNQIVSDFNKKFTDYVDLFTFRTLLELCGCPKYKFCGHVIYTLSYNYMEGILKWLLDILFDKVKPI